MRRRIFLAGGQRGLVIAVDPDDIGAIGRHRLLAGLADMRMDIDFRRAAGTRRAPGDGSSVIAVRGGGDGQAGGAATFGLKLADKSGDGIGAAERLEGSESETHRFILVDDPRDPDHLGDFGKIVKRRWRVSGPAADFRLRAVHDRRVKRAPPVGKGGGGMPGILCRW